MPGAFLHGGYYPIKVSCNVERFDSHIEVLSMAKQPIFEHGRLSRRHFLQSSAITLGAVGGATSTLPLSTALADTPQAGGMARIRGWDPLGWDPFRTASYRTHVALSFTHNRLFRYQSGPDVEIGAMVVEKELVER